MRTRSGPDTTKLRKVDTIGNKAGPSNADCRDQVYDAIRKLTAGPAADECGAGRQAALKRNPPLRGQDRAPDIDD